MGVKAVLPHADEFPEGMPRNYDKVEAIQKVLYDTDNWFYFYKGISIAENNSNVVMTSEAKKDYSLYDTDELKIRGLLFLLFSRRHSEFREVR